jgi:mannitol/fructose-specific phosphotransferase system IIA component (Ntr-type)
MSDEVALKLTDLISETAVVQLKSVNKEGAIRELVQALHHSEHIMHEDVERVIEQVMERENESSTGLGRGMALPHARTDSVGRLVGALGHSSKGLEFSSIDGDPVYAVIMILSPTDQKTAYVQSLSLVFKLFGESVLCRKFREAESRGALLKLLNTAHDYID